ncbi:YopX family protein [Mammaliicoccus sciuri]|uniref:YopX family protein n=1 Tax=Mammaliicoccus sciuri TaxID=1296 RepID=UPI001FB2AB67|nr:YopX family protein [Mammaliicoccus sciuri]MCJ1757893.1 YopX family protein [Mammaliicoccus sciuri]
MIPKVIAWDKVNKEMIEDVASIHFKTELIVTSNLCFYLFKDIELLQSTGLLDKNGKEIFEGYIIDKGYSNIDIVDRIGYVKFGTGDDSDGYLNQEWLGWTTNNDDSLLDVHEHCTVLGNKFENPELLGEDTQ